MRILVSALLMAPFIVALSIPLLTEQVGTGRRTLSATITIVDPSGNPVEGLLVRSQGHSEAETDLGLTDGLGQVSTTLTLVVTTRSSVWNRNPVPIPNLGAILLEVIDPGTEEVVASAWLSMLDPTIRWPDEMDITLPLATEAGP
ncbi:MAG: hypothetical protein KF774_08005 [Planctomyces sp.]|nr:hypothetical protein [Planctomyces sp.]